MPAGTNWTHDETLMAFVLYRSLPPRECDDTGAKVQELAKALGRTANSVAMKIWNIAAHDEVRKGKGRTSLKHGSKLDVIIWEEYDARGDQLIAEGIDLIEHTVNEGVLQEPESTELEVPQGKERTATTVVRVNQNYFRNTLLDSYRGKCCLTGLSIEKLLVASHIKPWKASKDRDEKLNPANGLLLNALHDKAFDQGLITIDYDYRVRVSPQVRRTAEGADVLYRYQGKQIELPKYRRPAREFIEYHNDMVFQH